MKAGLVQMQSTKLALTNELRQAITLLQYTSFELMDYINDISLENPFIKLHKPVSISKSKSHGKTSLQKLDFDPVASNIPTLYEYAKSQIVTQRLNTGILTRINYLLHNMDENGYIRESLLELATRTEFTSSELQEALDFIQLNLEPMGIGARDLQQSLLIQLKRKYPSDKIAHKLVEHYFTPFAEKKWGLISKELNISVETIQKSFDLVRTLNPRPGSEFKKELTTYIVPDFCIEKSSGSYRVFLNERAQVSFSIDKQYATYKNKQVDQTTANYLKEKYQQALWLKNSMEQRKRTMLAVMEEILKRQSKFFDHGVSYLQPLTLNEIAEAINVHESTISRTVRGKYVQTSRGVFELKYFFHSKVKSKSDEDISSVSVKEMISQMINQENKRKPLSDQIIANLLNKDHQVTISRRTVTKYREQLLFPSSTARKQY